MKKKTARRKLAFQTLQDYKHEKGDTAVFTREQAPGAIPNGTLVVKTNTTPEDAHQDGHPAHVLGSMKVDTGKLTEEIYYFVEWLDKPGMPVLVMGTKIQREQH